MERVRQEAAAAKKRGFLNPRIPFLNKNSVLAWKYTLLEILKSRHIEINTKLSGGDHIPKTCRFASVGEIPPGWLGASPGVLAGILRLGPLRKSKLVVGRP